MTLVIGSVVAFTLQLVAPSVAHSSLHIATEARNGRIAYILGSTMGSTDVASIRPAGTGTLNLTASEANELYVDVSPDGTSIAFTRFTRRGGEIFTVPVTGGRARRLTRDRVHDELPIWSPDSSRIAFVRYAGAADAEIFVIDADGSNIVRITENDADDADDADPDGRRTGPSWYTSGSIDLDEQDVYLVTLADLSTRKLTSDEVNDSFAEWAPDGTRIAYASHRSEQWDIYVVTADGTATMQLTSDPTMSGLDGRRMEAGSSTSTDASRGSFHPTRCT